MSEQVLASGNLASVRRMATSLLAQLEFFGVEESVARQIISAAGLPSRVLDEPDFPISLTQELQVCLSLIQHLGRDIHPVTMLFAHTRELGIEMMAGENPDPQGRLPSDLWPARRRVSSPQAKQQVQLSSTVARVRPERYFSGQSWLTPLPKGCRSLGKEARDHHL